MANNASLIDEVRTIPAAGLVCAHHAKPYVHMLINLIGHRQNIVLP